MINAMTLILILLDGDVPRLASYGVYISQLIRFASLLESAIMLRTLLREINV